MPVHFRRRPTTVLQAASAPSQTATRRQDTRRSASGRAAPRRSPPPARSPPAGPAQRRQHLVRPARLEQPAQAHRAPPPTGTRRRGRSRRSRPPSGSTRRTAALVTPRRPRGTPRRRPARSPPPPDPPPPSASPASPPPPSPTRACFPRTNGNIPCRHRGPPLLGCSILFQGYRLRDASSVHIHPPAPVSVITHQGFVVHSSPWKRHSTGVPVR